MVAEVATHARDVARDAQRVINSVREGVGKAWFAHRLEPSSPGADRRHAFVSGAAALLRVDGIAAKIESTATDWVKERLDQFRVQILNTSRCHSRRLHAGAGADLRRPRPSRCSCARTSGLRRRTAKGDDLPRYPGPRVRGRGRDVPGGPQRLGAHGRRGRTRPDGLRRVVSEPGQRRRRPRSGSPTRTTRTSGRRSSPTSSSCRDARMAPSAHRSSTRTATTLPMPERSSGRSRRSPSSLATGSCVSSRWPRSRMGACGCWTSLIRPFVPRYEASMAGR